MPATQAAPAGVRFYLILPQELFQMYESQARQVGFSIEDYIAYRLVKCRLHTADKGIYLDDEDRQELSRGLGVNLQDSSQLRKAVSKCLQLKVSGTPIDLSPDLLERLKTRCFEPDFGSFVARLAVEGLESFAGLR